MAEIERVPLSKLPDAGQLDGDELLYTLDDPAAQKVSRKTTVARVRQGLATHDDLAAISVGEGNVPPGGAAGAALIKRSADSYDMVWDPTGGTGWVPDPTNEPDGRKLVTQTGGLVYADDDGSVLPDPDGEADGLMLVTDDGSYVLAPIPEPPPPPVESVNGQTGTVTLGPGDVGADAAGAAAAAETAAKAASVPLASGIVVVDSPTPVARPAAAIVLWLDDATNAITGDWRPAAE